ncbi:ShlB/FhaC/HecB family hemolysin secretion/activation protein [Trabulsiella odontotermitis]|uniref:ShlB/FhaC/HecB family hemolysin secretion/activation protein n=1 Tax=Trabulsiella odontotermitis TaxID=379893 RepID=UPI00067602AF|nr:POTRA domain-containing protein [Trabulsiella odontotermitis]KNC92580.1 hypothetical protein GM30_15915 [Trabulsiella odontotermitis]
MKFPIYLALFAHVTILPFASAENLPAIIDKDNPTRLADSNPGAASAKYHQQVTITPPKTTRSPDTRIQVNHIQFIGGTIYPLKTLLEPFRPYAKKSVPLKTLAGLVNQITARYQADGYPLSYAWLPAENFHDGNIKIVLVEGYVARTENQSNSKNIAALQKRLSEKIMREKPLTQDTFDRYSMLMTQIPGVPVNVSAQMPQNIYGAGVMQVKSDQPHMWDLSSTVDTRKGQNLAVVNGTLSNLTSHGDQLGLATIVPLDSGTRQTYFGMNYQQYLNDDGLTLRMKGSYYRETEKEYTPLLNLPRNITVDVRPTSTQYNLGASLYYPFLLTRKAQWGLTGGVDYTHKRDVYRLQARGFGQTIPLESQKQSVHYPALEMGVNGFRAFSKGSLGGKLTLRQGVSESSSTQGEDTDFTLLKSNLDGAWMMSDHWRLSAALEGDWSANHLPEPERVNFGAQHFGRGYQDGEASGDFGYGAQAELRYLHTRKEAKWLTTVQPYILADTAITGFNQSGFNHQHLSSIAGGVMLGDNRHYSMTLEAARPVGNVPSDSHQRSWRYSLTVTWNFNNFR